MTESTAHRQWRAWRQEGIGGSDAAAIVGLDPFKTAMGIWLSKVGDLGEDDSDRDEVMQWGHRLEPVIAKEFEDQTGMLVQDRQDVRQHPEIPYMRATIDGVVYSDKIGETLADAPIRHAVGLYEAKTASRRADDWSEGVPDHVQIQIQHNLAVTGLPKAWVAALLLSPVPRLHIHELERDEAAIAALLEAEADFWQRVVERRPPPVDASVRTAEALRAAYGEATPGAEVELDHDQAALVRMWLTAKALEREAEKSRWLAENSLMAIMKDAERATYRGVTVVSWKSYTQQRIDSDALRKERPAIAATYTHMLSGRRLLVKGGKEIEGADDGEQQ